MVVNSLIGKYGIGVSVLMENISGFDEKCEPFITNKFFQY